MVEQKPSKLTTRVRFPSPAPDIHQGHDKREHQRGDPDAAHGEPAGTSAPLKRATRGPCGSVVEHSLGKGEVTRSIRVMGTR